MGKIQNPTGGKKNTVVCPPSASCPFLCLTAMKEVILSSPSGGGGQQPGGGALFTPGRFVIAPRSIIDIIGPPRAAGQGSMGAAAFCFSVCFFSPTPVLAPLTSCSFRGVSEESSRPAWTGSSTQLLINDSGIDWPQQPADEKNLRLDTAKHLG